MQHSKEKCIKPKTEHNWYYVALVLGLIVLYTICIGFNILSSIGSAKRNLMNLIIKKLIK